MTEQSQNHNYTNFVNEHVWSLHNSKKLHNTTKTNQEPEQSTTLYSDTEHLQG
jgi:hypothetical protein